jgi:hypothetical protein
LESVPKTHVTEKKFWNAKKLHAIELLYWYKSGRSYQVGMKGVSVFNAPYKANTRSVVEPAIGEIIMLVL